MRPVDENSVRSVIIDYMKKSPVKEHTARSLSNVLKKNEGHVRATMLRLCKENILGKTFSEETFKNGQRKNVFFLRENDFIDPSIVSSPPRETL